MFSSLLNSTCILYFLLFSFLLLFFFAFSYLFFTFLLFSSVPLSLFFSFLFSYHLLFVFSLLLRSVVIWFFSDLFTFQACRPNWNVLRLYSIIRHLIIWHLIFWYFCLTPFTSLTPSPSPLPPSRRKPWTLNWSYSCVTALHRPQACMFPNPYYST